MKLRSLKITPFSFAVIAVLTVTATACVFAFSCSGTDVVFGCEYYYVCYAITDNSVSASSISGAVSGYGGAGYILEYDKNFYVTVSCYYKQNDAETVCAGLKKRDMDCTVLQVERSDYRIGGVGRETDGKLYEGNLNTLHSLSVMAYDCANALDTGDYGQNDAKGVLTGIAGGLKGLIKANPDNCFSNELRRLYAVCADLNGGYIYSKDLRKLQIAITDTVINVNLY